LRCAITAYEVFCGTSLSISGPVESIDVRLLFHGSSSKKKIVPHLVVGAAQPEIHGAAFDSVELCMSNIVRARELIEQIADNLDSGGKPQDAAQELRAVLALMKRRTYVRRAPVHSNPVTPAIKAQIQALAANNPTMHESEIAAQVGVNPGRVSEVLHGLR
jgi:hypothetical protein